MASLVNNFYRYIAKLACLPKLPVTNSFVSRSYLLADVVLVIVKVDVIDSMILDDSLDDLFPCYRLRRVYPGLAHSAMVDRSSNKREPY
jgi:hypothetical protein